MELRIRAMLAKLTDRVEQLLITFCFNEKSGSFTVFVVSILFPETHIIRNTYYYEYNFQEKSYIYIIYLIFIVFFSSATVTAGPPGALVGIVEAWRRGFR